MAKVVLAVDLEGHRNAAIIANLIRDHMAVIMVWIDHNTSMDHMKNVLLSLLG